MNASASQHRASVVTAILPNSTGRVVLDEVLTPSGHAALAWHARGTLLKDNWLQRFLPPISPAKTVLQVVLPDAAKDAVMQQIVDAAKLHQQATGAVYSQSCEQLLVGADFPALTSLDAAGTGAPARPLSADLSLITCIVDRSRSDRIARAAVAAGAHGPIIFLCEGRGLRDRLGWLRITKQHDKDVLSLLCGQADVDQVFQAMAVAGDLHLPGRGFMYRVDVTEGLYNLPSLISNRHYAANVQQIINAIDHLTGHTHWRDGALQSVGSGANAAGLNFARNDTLATPDMVCLTAVVPRDAHESLIDHFLDHGVKGVNFTFARYENATVETRLGDAAISDDYAVMNAVCAARVATSVTESLRACGDAAPARELMLFVRPVQQIATYRYAPGSQPDNRIPQPAQA